MLTCPNCSHQQTSGNFCGMCGTALQQTTNEETPANDHNTAKTEEPIDHQAAAEETASQSSANQAAENIKGGLNHYWHYVLNLLANPSRAFQTAESNVVSGLITLVISALTYALSIYFLAQSTSGAFNPYMEVPFFGLVSRLTFFALVYTALAYISTLLMTKASGHPDSAKTVLTQFGSIAVPFAAINTFSILPALAGFPMLTGILISLSYGILLFIMPSLFVYEKANASENEGQKVYLSLATLLIMIAFTLITVFILFAAMLNSLINMFSNVPM